MATHASDAKDADPQRLACKRCGRDLHPGRGELYVVSILVVADPSPPVFTKDDLTLDLGHEIRRLIAQMKDLNAYEAEDQVYRRLAFHLCTSCYNRWIENPTGF
jgi:hypothetical protein